MANKEVSLSVLEKGSGYRKILRVVDRGKDEVVLIIPALAMNYEGPNPYATRDELQSTTIAENRWSIHPSKKSLKQINLIKKTTRTVSTEIEDGFLVTSTIKSKSGFQPVFSRRVPRMKEPVFDVSGAGSTNIGTYNPKKLQLLTALLVGHKDVAFLPTIPDKSISIWVIEVGMYAVVLMASFLKFPAYQGNSREVYTNDPGPEFDGPFGTSMSPDQCINYFTKERILLAGDAFKNHPDVVNSKYYHGLLTNPKFLAIHPRDGRLVDGQMINLS
ncbi:hypothetical protein [Rhizobium tumorigenes]|uniref:Uncharacterized protein n=1 Tax=Rhizobium tumorigenes TaxID=2041385 RepID=A0AAF1KRM2_9HYPH|nr:hypothetical protein [Rhizobium tumorigenes]WFR96867.1 hypothetical protein PR017_07070 [Rhizobium tumorigenes]